ncbi:MAG TPA: BatA and WFA domain-containing protein, partial [Vicinamibacterales bacterium]
APLVLLGLGALAIPVVIHLIQREKKRVVEFPSLMFLRRIPYQSVRRRRIRHWALLLMRLTALALIVAAFARPFFRRQNLAAATQNGAREAVVLVDTSYSMGYGDRWAKAQAAAQQAINGLAAGDRGSLVLFSTGAELSVRSTADRGRLLAALSAASVGPGATRFAPALKLGGSLLGESPLPRREIILISDFQRRGWEEAPGHDDVRLPDRTVLTTIPVGDTATTNLSVTPVSLERTRFENQDRVVVTGGLTNHGATAVAHVPVTLEVNGRPIQTLPVDVAPNASASVSFAPLTVASRNMRATVRIPDDNLARDNIFDFVLSPSEPLKAVLVSRPGAERENLYVTRALAIGDAPRVDLVVRTADAVSDADLRNTAIVIVNDVQASDALATRLARFVSAGGGLLVAAGPHASWPAKGAEVLPALPAAAVDRTVGTPSRLGALEYGHPIFDLFRAPRSGDFSAARFYGYRGTEGEPTQVLARFDDGSPALMERRTGAGRALEWMSTLDLGWNDLPVKPVFLPFLHTMLRYLADYSEAPSSLTVGQVVPAARRGGPGAGPPSRGATIALAPSGARVTVGAEDGALELTEQGFYDVRTQGAGAESATTLASNVDLSESNLTPMDPRELVASATGHPAGQPGGFADARPSDDAQAQAQRLWWYLLVAGGLLLAAESLLSNRLSGGVS